MPTDSLLQGFILITGMTGQFLIAHQRISAFYVWLVSNFALILVSVLNGLWGLVLLYAFFSIMCLYSIRQWKARRLDSASGLTLQVVSVS